MVNDIVDNIVNHIVNHIVSGLWIGVDPREVRGALAKRSSDQSVAC